MTSSNAPPIRFSGRARRIPMLREQAQVLLRELCAAYEKTLPEPLTTFLLVRFVECEQAPMRQAISTLIDSQPLFPRWSRIREAYQGAFARQPQTVHNRASEARILGVEECARRRARMWQLVYRKYPRELFESIWDMKYFEQQRAYNESWLTDFAGISSLKSYDCALRNYYAVLCGIGQWASEMRGNADGGVQTPTGNRA